MTFGVKARSAQGKFRDTSPTISFYGKNPDDLKGKRNKHLLALGYEQENLFPGIRNDEPVSTFFADRGIKWWKSTRSGDDCKRSGPTRNMASSQIFCINFWYPIKDDTSVLTAIAKSIDPNIETVTEIHSNNVRGNQKLSSFVEFEWVGSSTTLEKKTYSRGANATSLDAFIVGISKQERIGLFFEWKMVEEYRENDLGKGKSGITRRNTYKPYIQSTNNVFSKDIPINDVLYEPFYQIFRMGLLGQKMIFEDEELDKVYVIPVYPRDNIAYSERITSQPLGNKFSNLKTISAIASNFFLEPVAYKSMFADELWSITKTYATSPEHKEWIEYMDARYFQNGI